MFRITENEKLAVAGVIVMALMAYSLFLTLRLRATYKAATEVALLQQELRTQVSEWEVTQKLIRKEIDEMEITLYAQPQPKVQTPPTVNRRPSTVEQWSANRDKELRDRIVQLERWRLHVDETLRQLR